MVRPDSAIPADEHLMADEQREVRYTDFVDGLVVLPDATTDDTDAGWGEHATDNDARLLAERPPHWE